MKSNKYDIIEDAMLPTDPKMLREKIQEMITDTIAQKLAHHEISPDRAVLIAKKILALLPEHITHDKLLRTIPLLQDEMSELAGVVHELLEEEDEELREKSIQQIRNFLESMKKIENS